MVTMVAAMVGVVIVSKCRSSSRCEHNEEEAKGNLLHTSIHIPAV